MEYEASGFGSDEDISSADNVSFQSPSDTSGLQENTESPPPVRKMFWHSLQIEKVQELVPEEIRWFYHFFILGFIWLKHITFFVLGVLLSIMLLNKNYYLFKIRVYSFV